MITFLTYNGNDAPTSFDLAEVGLNARRVARWIRAVAAEYGYSVGNITYLLCNDEQILAVNREFLQHDYYTDIITFDYTTAQCLNGDIFISLDTVRSNAEMVGATFNHELLRILIHGVLHLTGQADKTPETKAEMTRKEEEALLLIKN
ncbi:MAG: rRNA maturation RNase YbeY [Paludibacteraceae bacterium]